MKIRVRNLKGKNCGGSPEIEVGLWLSLKKKSELSKGRLPQKLLQTWAYGSTSADTYLP